MLSLRGAQTRDDVMEVCHMAVVFADLIRTSGRAAA
jgi:hypothetical protein